MTPRDIFNVADALSTGNHEAEWRPVMHKRQVVDVAVILHILTEIAPLVAIAWRQ